MSLSREERIANLEYALKVFVRDVNDNWIRHVHITPGGDEYDVIFETTWKELISRIFLEELSMPGYFFLTGHGWLTGLELLGRKTDKDFRERVGRLFKTFKDEVKGRHEDAFIFIEDAATRSGLPTGLIANVIESKMCEYWFGMHGAHWESYKGRGCGIIIPLNFGLELL